MSYQQYKQCFPEVKVENTGLNLRIYTGETITPRGCATVHVYHNEVIRLPLYILHQGATPLLGREWVRDLLPDRGSLNSMVVE